MDYSVFPSFKLKKKMYFRCRPSLWQHWGYDWISALALHEVLLEIS